MKLSQAEYDVLLDEFISHCETNSIMRRNIQSKPMLYDFCRQSFQLAIVHELRADSFPSGKLRNGVEVACTFLMGVKLGRDINSGTSQPSTQRSSVS